MFLTPPLVVGVSFTQNSSLFLPVDTTTFEVCVFLEGQLEREVRVNLTSSIDGEYIQAPTH